MSQTYYKVILPDGTSPTKEFDYAPYMPHDGVAGAWLPEISDARIGGRGYYVSKYWRIWYKAGARVFECQCRGVSVEELNGVEKQACCKTLRFVREITADITAEIGDARFNNGAGNLGLSNVGDANVGDFNIGSRNVGNLNSGDFNTGDSNTGIDNVGNDNRGSLNSGCSNTGHSNTGSFNRGSYNSGDFNTGHANSGSFNRGNRNTGKWNVCNYSSGFFNTAESPVYMFNKPTQLRASEIRLPKWLQKPDLRAALESADPADLRATFDLPNFDPEIFWQITGIAADEILRRLGDA